MTKTLQEVSGIVGVEVKETAKSRKRNGLGFGQAEEIVIAIEEMRGSINILSGMIQEVLERFKAIQLEQRKRKLDLAAFNPILSILRGYTSKDLSGRCVSAEALTDILTSTEQRWKKFLPSILLKLAPVAGLKVDGEDIVLGPPRRNVEPVS